MYGFWRLGVNPAPSKGAVCVSNGLATATSTNEKNVAIPANTGTTQAVRSRRCSEPAGVVVGGERADGERVDGQPEGDDEGRAPEVGHQLAGVLDVYLEGHFVRMSVPASRPAP